MSAPTISYLIRTSYLPVATDSANPTQPLYGDLSLSCSIIGTNFDTSKVVTVGGVECGSNYSGPTRIDFSVPWGPWSTGELLDVTVTTSGGSATATNAFANWRWYWDDPLGLSFQSEWEGLYNSLASNYTLLTGVDSADWEFPGGFGAGKLRVLTETGISWQDRTGHVTPTGTNMLEGVFGTGVRCWNVIVTPQYAGPISWATLNDSVGFMDTGTNGLSASIDSSGTLTLIAQDSTTSGFNQTASTTFSFSDLQADVATFAGIEAHSAGFRLALEFDPSTSALTGTIYLCTMLDLIPEPTSQFWGWGEGGNNTDSTDTWAANQGYNQGTQTYGTPWAQASLTLDSHVLAALKSRDLYPGNATSLGLAYYSYNSLTTYTYADVVVGSDTKIYYCYNGPVTGVDPVVDTVGGTITGVNWQLYPGTNAAAIFEWGYENQAPSYGASDVLSGSPNTFVDTVLPATETIIEGAGFPPSGLSLSDAHMVLMYDPSSFSTYFPSWSIVSNQLLIDIPDTYPDMAETDVVVYLPGLGCTDVNPLVIEVPPPPPLLITEWTYGPQGPALSGDLQFLGFMVERLILGNVSGLLYLTGGSSETFTPGPVPDFYRFDGTLSHPYIAQWTWFFDDGTIQYGPIVVKSFLSASGAHDVTLLVNDYYGRTASVTHTVTA